MQSQIFHHIKYSHNSLLLPLTFLGICFGAALPNFFPSVIFLHNLYLFPNFSSCSKKYTEPVRIENHFCSPWPPSLEFPSRYLVPGVKKREVNKSPAPTCAVFLSWAVARAHFLLWARCHCCGFLPGKTQSPGSGDGQWMCGHLRRPEPEWHRSAGQQVSLGLPPPPSCACAFLFSFSGFLSSFCDFYSLFLVAFLACFSVRVRINCMRDSVSCLDVY